MLLYKLKHCREYVFLWAIAASWNELFGLLHDVHFAQMDLSACKAPAMMYVGEVLTLSFAVIANVHIFYPKQAWLQSAHVHTNNALPTALLGFETPLDWAWYHSGTQTDSVHQNPKKRPVVLRAVELLSVWTAGWHKLTHAALRRNRASKSLFALMLLFFTGDEKEPDPVVMNFKTV